MRQKATGLRSNHVLKTTPGFSNLSFVVVSDFLAPGAFDEAAKDKNGITVTYHTSGLDFGVIDVNTAQNGASLNLTIKNSVPLSKVALSEVRVISSLQRTTPLVIIPDVLTYF